MSITATSRSGGPEATTSRLVFGEKLGQEPPVWNRQAEKQGRRLYVFCAWLADVFEEHSALASERLKLRRLNEITLWLNWPLLTKWPRNIRKMSPWSTPWPKNVWVGTSAGLQKRGATEIPLLLEVPAVVRFVSIEP